MAREQWRTESKTAVTGPQWLAATLFLKQTAVGDSYSVSTGWSSMLLLLALICKNGMKKKYKIKNDNLCIYAWITL